MPNLLEHPETVVPSTEDADLAARASRALAANNGGGVLKVRIDDSAELVLPKAATRLLSHILDEMATGNAVTVIPIHAELTTQHAADYLNVSRPHLVKLLQKGDIPFHMVGTHRRVQFSDLTAYKKKIEVERQRAMEELSAEAQRLEMGY
jgi:excisionase family DNA binding protein